MNERTYYHHEPLSPQLVDRLDRIEQAQALILKGIRHMTKSTDDLNAAIVNLTGVMTSGLSEIQTLTQAVVDAHAGDDSAAVEAAVGKINDLATSMQTAVAAANSAVTAASAAAPAAPASSAPPPAAPVEQPAPAAPAPTESQAPAPESAAPAPASQPPQS